MAGMKLYNYWRSTSSWRIRIALAHKGLRYDYQAVHLVRGGGEQNGPDYQAINPTRTVPLLEDEVDGKPWRLSQSMAILEYLEERYPTPPLLPRAPLARARARQYAEAINSGMQPYQNLAVSQYVRDTLKGDVQAWTQHWLGRGLTALETQVAETAGRFCVGDEVSFADVMLVPQLFGARRVSVNLSPYPRLLAIEAACTALPAFQTSRPELQPDAEH